MKYNLIEKPKTFTCSNERCKKKFFVTTKGIVFVEAILLKNVSEYCYCSQKCFDEIMSIMKNPPVINENTVVFVREELISTYPKKWRFILKPAIKINVN